MKTRYKFIRFEQLTDSDWICLCNRDNSILGGLEFYSRWKTWTFNPADVTRFSIDCLQDIIHFIGQLPKP